MKKLSDLLLRHPLAILLMFAVSLLSGIMGIALGWKQFYDSYLSRSVDIPVWLVLLVLFLLLPVYFFQPSRRSRPKELELVEGKQFGVQPVEVDGMRFVNCKFDGSELVFHGTDGFSLEHNSFSAVPRFRFNGSAATTLGMLKALRNDPTFRQVIDASFQDSRAVA